VNPIITLRVYVKNSEIHEHGIEENNSFSSKLDETLYDQNEHKCRLAKHYAMLIIPFN